MGDKVLKWILIMLFIASASLYIREFIKIFNFVISVS